MFAYLALVEGQGLDLPLLLQTVDDVLVAPANFVGQTLQQHIARQFVPLRESEMTRRTFTVQYFRPGFNRNTLRASGTTMRFLRS